jgi:hypothetical protein
MTRMKIAVLLLAGIGLAWLTLSLSAGPADCAWCPPAPCLTSTSCGDCECLIVGDETRGRCVAQVGDD